MIRPLDRGRSPRGAIGRLERRQGRARRGHAHRLCGGRRQELLRLLQIPVRDVVPGRAGLMGLSDEEKSNPDNLVPKFKNGSFNIIRAGGNAGKYSAIIPSIGGKGSIEPVTREIK